MSKKILLAAGCSYTDKNFRSSDDSLPDVGRSGWPMWPELMANELNLECVNLGKSGASSDFIFREVIKGIASHGDKIDTIAILWSGADRESFYTFDFNALMEVYNDYGNNSKITSWMDDIGIGEINKKFWNNKNFNKDVYKNMIESQLSRMIAIIDICKARNIKLIMGQGLTFFSFWVLDEMQKEGRLNPAAYIDKSQTIQYFMDNPMFDQIEKTKNSIIGWPFWPLLNGYFLDILRYDHKENCFISDKDKHPNKLGQEIFAQEFINKYKELYI